MRCNYGRYVTVLSKSVIKLGILKMGCIGSASLIEFVLDERAERRDIDTKVIGTGASMAKKRCEDAAMELANYEPDFAITVSPNATLPGPTAARNVLVNKDIPIIVISDSPTRKITSELEAKGLGYIIPEAESMIGARREFLDPVEMALFNADIIKVLAITGVFNVIVESIDNVICSFKKEEKILLPTLIIDKQVAINASGLVNSYARSKAMAAFTISRRVSELNTEGCFRIKNWETYITVVAAAHEMMRHAAKLADEARELEKCGDSVRRQPHARDGTIMYKTKLIEKPKKTG